MYFFDLVPGVEPDWISIFRRVLTGETVSHRALRAETGGIISFWDVVFTPLIEDGEVVGIMDVTTNVTERKVAEEQLREREEQYRGIFESTTDALLIFDCDGTVVEANPAACTMLGYPYEELIGLSRQDIMHSDYYHLFEDFRRRAEAGERFHAQAIIMRRDGSMIDAEVHGTPFSYKGTPHVLTVTRDITERVRAYQTLEQEVIKRTRELQTLLDVTAAASSSLALDEMLSATLDRLVLLVGASRAGVLLHDESSGELTLRMVRPHQIIGQDDQAKLVRLGLDVVAGGKPLYSQEREPTALLPLRSRGQALGVLSIAGTEGGIFSGQQVALFEAIADQLGVAIENARLYEQAEQAAAIEERQRLARELHDSVTQSLYSVTLFAEAARRLAKVRDLDHVEDYLDRLGETAQEALKELRMLVYELRPWALEREGLVGALQQRLDAVEKRSSIEARLLVEGTIELPAAVEEGLYRIAQEALNNALKHAGATAVTVRIHADAQRVELEVTDNGRGFNTNGDMGDRGGVGLINMRERAERIGGSLTVNSLLGEGTKVKINVETCENPNEPV
ncbi:MAG: PAS domain S-box protein [Candidatus Marsarchaeota archaeon]|nr:PAS domain S-box protein [Candidatus Marsarchaeota archaeon]